MVIHLHANAQTSCPLNLRPSLPLSLKYLQYVLLEEFVILGPRKYELIA